MVRKIFLVGDFQAERDDVHAPLSHRGFEVIEVRDGRKALDVLTTIDDLVMIITNLDLSSFSGIELVKEVRRREAHAELPCVLLTPLGDYSINLVHQAREVGVAAWINLPLCDDTVDVLCGLLD